MWNVLRVAIVRNGANVLSVVTASVGNVRNEAMIAASVTTVAKGANVRNVTNIV